AQSYRNEEQRRKLETASVDMDGYLKSLEMVAIAAPLASLDVPRAAQLINKSNQFNPTTRRRSEAEVQQLLGVPEVSCFTMRLADRFGDHGLISVVITTAIGDALEVDTWVMSCRVLKRQVEE